MNLMLFLISHWDGIGELHDGSKPRTIAHGATTKTGIIYLFQHDESKAPPNFDMNLQQNPAAPPLPEHSDQWTDAEVQLFFRSGGLLKPLISPWGQGKAVSFCV